MVDVENAVKVVYLVLQGLCQEVVGSQPYLFAGTVKPLDPDYLSPLHLREIPRDTKTTFIDMTFACPAYYLRVYQDELFLLRHTDNNHANGNAYLRCCQTDTRRRVHGLYHIINKLLY